MVATPGELGVVYTPPEVTAPMVVTALTPLVAGRPATEILALRVCDPAIGEGAFVTEIIRFLTGAVLAAWRADERTAPDDPTTWARVAEARCARCVVGVDVDARAVQAARDANPGADLRVGDALALDWGEAFPDDRARGGFDAVLGNPPYIRQERIAVHKAGLRTFAVYDGVADLYVYFVELAHRIVRPGGRYCLIVPNKWMTAAYGRRLRAYLAERASVEGLADFARSQLFRDADAFPCIIWGTVGDRAGVTTIGASRVDARTSVAEALAAPGVPHERARWTAEPWHVDAGDERALIDRLERRWPALDQVIAGRPSRGVVTGCNRAFVIDAATREGLLAAEPAAEVLIRPLVRGRDVRRFVPGCSERWILLIDRGTSLAALPGITGHLAGFRDALEPRPVEHRGPWAGRKPGAYQWYELQDPVGPLVKARLPRLLYQDIQTAPACCLDRDGVLVPDTTVWILPSEDLVVLAILNSSLYGWYSRRRFPPALNGAVRPKLEYVRRFPIASPSPDLRRAIEALVRQRIATGDGALDGALDAAIAEAYELSSDDRAALRQG